jgi:hypothetical protein
MSFIFPPSRSVLIRQRPYPAYRPRSGSLDRDRSSTHRPPAAESQTDHPGWQSQCAGQSVGSPEMRARSVHRCLPLTTVAAGTTDKVEVRCSRNGPFGVLWCGLKCVRLRGRQPASIIEKSHKSRTTFPEAPAQLCQKKLAEAAEDARLQGTPQLPGRSMQHYVSNVHLGSL